MRAETHITGNKLGGYAVVFNKPADLGYGKEQLLPGSLDRALVHSDIRSLFNHDPSMVLGRQKSNTLRLKVDSTGLEYEVDLPKTTYADDLRELVERGDIDGTSFAFTPDALEYDRANELVTHTSVASISDVSPVTYPAYETTTTELRWKSSFYVRRRSQLIRARARRSF